MGDFWVSRAKGALPPNSNRPIVCCASYTVWVRMILLHCCTHSLVLNPVSVTKWKDKKGYCDFLFYNSHSSVFCQNWKSISLNSEFSFSKFRVYFLQFLSFYLFCGQKDLSIVQHAYFLQEVVWYIQFHINAQNHIFCSQHAFQN